ncbi:MAG: ribbon-helix-helix protein, CopG family [Candidatus Magasanikbacteria bacterium]
MKRTQLYIPENLHKKIKAEAREEGRSMSDLMREFLAEGLDNKKKQKGQVDLTDLANLNLSGGPKDLSKNMDNYLYDNE